MVTRSHLERLDSDKMCRNLVTFGDLEGTSRFFPGFFMTFTMLRLDFSLPHPYNAHSIFPKHLFSCLREYQLVLMVFN